MRHPLAEKSAPRKETEKSATEHSQLASANEAGQQVPRPTDEQSQLLYCELCDVKTTDLEPMLEHYRCGKHAKNFSLLGVTKKIFDPQVYQTRFRKLDEEIKRRRNGIFRCHQCSLTFRTKRRYKIHLA
ncbi:c2H2-type domain-containing protein, partial [Caerostris extrusa]